MTWFKVDDSFHSHPKVLATSPAALGLWVVAGAWCSSNLTDGFVPDYALPRLLPDSGPLAEQLATSGLWKRTKGGYRFHGWGDYNPTSDSVKADREAARERMRSVREKRRQTKEPAGQTTNGSGEHMANVRENFGRSSATPTRPDPTRSSSKEELLPQTTPSSSVARKRGGRIPDNFAATPEMIEWARTNTPHVGTRETEAFIDYWRAVAGAKGIKLDWTATWRNWMRRAENDRGARGSPPGQREHNGLVLNDRTIANIERGERMAALDAARHQQQQLAIEGGAA